MQLYEVISKKEKTKSQMIEKAIDEKYIHAMRQIYWLSFPSVGIVVDHPVLHWAKYA